jgi:hypothetical protein
MRKFRNAIIDGEVCENYFVDDDGDLWSNMRGSRLRKLKPNVGGNTPYPRLQLMINGNKKHAQLHRVVCETFHQFPVPASVSKIEWNNTPETVKNLMKCLFQVNHIDHDHKNYHPSNLEWVTVKENQNKYQEHKRNEDKNKIEEGTESHSERSSNTEVSLESFFI